MAFTPRTVSLTGHGAQVDWSDGHRSLYPYKYLRVRCSCAHCVDEWTRAPLLDPDSVPEDIVALEWDQVGAYALQFLFSDAHYHGIYTFERLREICPCPECRTRQLQGEQRL